MGNPGPQLWKVVGSVAAKKRREGGGKTLPAACKWDWYAPSTSQPTDRPRPRPTSRRSTVQSAKRKRITPQSQTFLDSPSAVNYIVVRQMMRWWHTPPFVQPEIRSGRIAEFEDSCAVSKESSIHTSPLNNCRCSSPWSQIMVAMFASLLISPREM